MDQNVTFLSNWFQFIFLHIFLVWNLSFCGLLTIFHSRREEAKSKSKTNEKMLKYFKLNNIFWKKKYKNFVIN